ncbi:riboflavin biosynthesis protein RibF (riboflavin kinase/FMN adenylyltransferase) [Legionella moravica]|uniref:Riboflavin biosynthesis protein n=1 Tax=Legionella moravica TaxID=39962 RepID=A0A378K5V1_9GAMM|nr:bifunctional riboflavin kinase/FAD synthetase [Legionella moravica]KTD31147.1 riboflavin biosynthesis protein RibF (riboflavin kinase/FMN adenylyltransferase) [Legionella moravica]STX63231.1 riboflavin biosynthesis protein RibF (riboflavin kinase/FMN adenylyltransferase) [Legionella moravica]
MKLLRGVQHFAEIEKGVVATIGNFDGIHLGHQNLIKTLRDRANSMKLPLVLILFEPQPREYFQKEAAPARLSSLREKLEMLRSCRVDYVYCIKFDRGLAETTAVDFATQNLFRALKVKYLLVGEDFRFGKNRTGDVQLLKTLGTSFSCQVDTCPDFFIENEKVSSTKIRNALQHGDLKLAARFLGRTYSLCGRVIRGDGRGRQWGIPTANLNLNRLALPLVGVYVVHVRIGSRYVEGVANIGKRPTVDGTKNILEIHLLNFNDSIYGELVQVFFLHRLRDELKFTSVDALITQIHNDIAAAKAFLNLNVQ